MSFKNWSLFVIFSLIFTRINSQPICTGTIVNITFGAGSINPGPELAKAAPGATTTYYLALYATGNPPAPPIDGNYALVNAVPKNGNWYEGALDHTGNPNGYMAFFNASIALGEFYRQNISGLSPDTTYEFSSWIANVINPAVLPTAILPNITFEILDTTTHSALASYNTGNIQNSSSMTWTRYSVLFTVPKGTSTITLKLSNNNIGGFQQPGNDLAIDDIVFSPCLYSLPLVLKNFQGNIDNKAVFLTWKTFNEINMVSNIIERSYDGFNFTSISSLPAKASYHENKYNFTDYPSFLNKTAYYRLKLIDKDGKFTNSNILTFSLGTQVLDNINLLPNPAKNYVQIYCTSNKEEFTTIKVIDIAGKTVIEQLTHLSKGQNSISIDFKNQLQKGVYFVQLLINKKSLTSKLLIN